jgi:uncharacterized phiE125 gp8 family phage protein
MLGSLALEETPMIIVTPPTVSPVSVEEAKSYLRIDHSDEDLTIQALIDTAVDYAENYTGRALITQVWEETYSEFPREGYIQIPKAPLQTIDDFEYTEANETTADFADYTADLFRNRAVLNYDESWPSCTLEPVEGIRIEWTCGYGDDGTDVPEAIRQAIMLLVGHWYENREPVIIGTIQSNLPFAVQALLNPYRTWEFV